MLSSLKCEINTNIMNDPNSKDFLEDLSNLSDELKHPSDKDSKIDEINVDDLLDDPLDDPIVKQEYESLPVITKQEDQQLVVAEKPEIPPSNSNSEDIHNYILKQCQDIIMQGKSTLEQLQDTVVNTCDGKAINGYATLVASLSKVLDTANSIGMEKSRIKSSIDMENLKHQHKTQQKASENPGTQNTVNIIAGREEVMKMLNKMSAQEIEAT